MGYGGGTEKGPTRNISDSQRGTVDLESFCKPIILHTEKNKSMPRSS